MNKKIFLIEDDANLLSSIQAKLSLAGYQIKTNSGNVEIELIIREIKNFNPDLIILDLLLPVVDGFEILKALKADEQAKEKKVFIFTNLSDEDSRKRGIELGANHFFAKSDFNPDSFTEKISKILSNQEKVQ
ncbi:MAG: response regulator [Patescibacteria group bacterium]